MSTDCVLENVFRDRLATIQNNNINIKCLTWKKEVAVRRGRKGTSSTVMIPTCLNA